MSRHEPTENSEQDMPGSTPSDPATPDAGPGSPKSPSGDSFFKDVDEHRRRQGPRGRCNAITLAELVSQHDLEAERDRARREAAKAKRAQEGSFAPDQPLGKRIVQLTLYFDLLDAIDKADRAKAERAVRKLEVITGLRISLPPDWPSQPRGKS